MIEEKYSVWVVTQHGLIKMGDESILDYFSPNHMRMKNYVLIRETKEVV